MEDNSWLRIQVDRPLYEQEQLNNEFKYEHRKSRGCLGELPSSFSCNTKSALYTIIPVLKWLPNYKWKRDFLSDLIAGLTVAVMHIPQGMAYSLLGNVPAVVGIYTALFPVAVYFLLGTSKHNSMGTFAIICLMTGNVVLEFSNPAFFISNSVVNTSSPLEDDAVPVVNYNYYPMEVVSALTFTIALFQIAMFILRLGIVSSLLSDALISGFTTAASIQVVTSQVKDLLGITIPKSKGYFVVINTWISIFKCMRSTNLAALLISVVTIIVIVINNEVLKPKLAKICSIPVPIELLAVIIGASISQYWQMNSLYNIDIIGHIPSGLPAPSIPNFSLVTTLAVDALIIAIVSYVMELSMALIFAHKQSYEVDANQELLAMGAGNVIGSFFSSMPFTASISRSMIQQTVGGKTQVASIVSCGILLFVILWIGPLFEPLPKCILASVIVVSFKGMLMQVTELIIFWKSNKLDALVWIVTFITVVLVSIDVGLLLGLMLSLFTLVVLAFKPYTCLLGIAPGTNIYLDVTRYRRAIQIQGLKIFQYRGGINFATTSMFKEKLYSDLEFNPQKELVTRRKLAKLLTLEELNSRCLPKSKLQHKLEKLYKKTQTSLKCIILDFSAVSFIDSSGVATLKQVADDFYRVDIPVYVAGCSGPVFDAIWKPNIQSLHKTVIKFFPSVHDAVQTATANLDLINHF